MANQENPEQVPYETQYLSVEEAFDAFIQASNRLNESHHALFRMFTAEDDVGDDTESRARELKKRHEAFMEAGDDVNSTLNDFIKAYRSIRRRLFNLGVLSALNQADRFDLLGKFPDAEALHQIIEARALANKLIDEKGFEFIEYDPDE